MGAGGTAAFVFLGGKRRSQANTPYFFKIIKAAAPPGYGYAFGLPDFSFCLDAKRNKKIKAWLLGGPL
ncbi:MAG: hypothetical protein LBH61_06450 [Dysgonamonadaceae bacterium]|jgi:hypothetical protein|nr:hypothetical protein [Dysgonamonadaceae bacterium]